MEPDISNTYELPIKINLYAEDIETILKRILYITNKRVGRAALSKGRVIDLRMEIDGYI